MKTELLTTCPTNYQAEIIKGILSSEGITCMLINSNFSSLVPMYYGIFGSGVQVRVFEMDLERAKIVVNLEDDYNECPNCGSKDVVLTFKNWKERLLVFFTLIFGTPIGNIMTNYKCKNCGHKMDINNA